MLQSGEVGIVWVCTNNNNNNKKPISIRCISDILRRADTKSRVIYFFTKCFSLLMEGVIPVNLPRLQFMCKISKCPVILSPQSATAPRGSEPPHYRGITITLKRTTLSRTPLDGWSARRRDLYLTTHSTHKKQTSMTPAGFEPTFPATEWPKTHSLDCVVTGIGEFLYQVPKNLRFNFGNRPDNCVCESSLCLLCVSWQTLIHIHRLKYTSISSVQVAPMLNNMS